ncbi:Lcl domain-containing protein, partial [Comamonas thiooxydans]|uniref:Lcl domain-containing protein n=1 Tax=Comamonas thiooxydans TaxID=363952 RepID=UPI00209C18D3
MIAASSSPRLPSPLLTSLAVLCLAAQPASAQPVVSAAPAFQLSPDASMVIDTRARLAWPRCAEGMGWNGKTCSGQAQVFSHKQAMSHAAERSKAENLRWRLPRVNELKRLLDRSSKPQGLNPELFP